MCPAASAPEDVLPVRRSIATGRPVIDVDRQKAPLAVMTISERKLLVAMHDVAGIIDVQPQRRGRRG
jgi:hypothetical protein